MDGKSSKKTEGSSQPSERPIAKMKPRVTSPDASSVEEKSDDQSRGSPSSEKSKPAGLNFNAGHTFLDFNSGPASAKEVAWREKMRNSSDAEKAEIRDLINRHQPMPNERPLEGVKYSDLAPKAVQELAGLHIENALGSSEPKASPIFTIPSIPSSEFPSVLPSPSSGKPVFSFGVASPAGSKPPSQKSRPETPSHGAGEVTDAFSFSPAEMEEQRKAAVAQVQAQMALQLNSVVDELSRHRKAMEDLKVNHAEATAALAEVKRDNQTLETQMTAADGRHAELDSHLTDARKKIGVQERLIERLRQDTDEAESKAKQKLAEAQSLQNSFASLKEDNARLLRDLLEAQEDREAEKEKARLRESALESMSGAADDLEATNAQIERLQQELEDMRASGSVAIAGRATGEGATGDAAPFSAVSAGGTNRLSITLKDLSDDSRLHDELSELLAAAEMAEDAELGGDEAPRTPNLGSPGAEERGRRRTVSSRVYATTAVQTEPATVLPGEKGKSRMEDKATMTRSPASLAKETGTQTQTQTAEEVVGEGTPYALLPSSWSSGLQAVLGNHWAPTLYNLLFSLCIILWLAQWYSMYVQRRAWMSANELSREMLLAARAQQKMAVLMPPPQHWFWGSIVSATPTWVDSLTTLVETWLNVDPSLPG
ncbi:MAG: hypothetical protein M1825_002651 [Sarcosagium campestre]|nr:MAG: hypothetical protein M1825_002651 [Sarcosagium campestre]